MMSECSNELGFNIGLINNWEAYIYRSFINLNGFWLNLSELGDDSSSGSSDSNMLSNVDADYCT